MKYVKEKIVDGVINILGMFAAVSLIGALIGVMLKIIIFIMGN